MLSVGAIQAECRKFYSSIWTPVTTRVQRVESSVRCLSGTIVQVCQSYKGRYSRKMRNGRLKTTEGERSLLDYQGSRPSLASQAHFRKKGKNWTRLHGMRSSPDPSLFLENGSGLQDYRSRRDKQREIVEKTNTRG